jgi:2-methylisocitrate lyase-like PEP mutase family enzyme
MTVERTRVFHKLHEAGCFVIPNPWDIGSARALAGLGFKALATTSSGFAAANGSMDHKLSLEDILAHCRALAASVNVPVSADFEGGFAVAPAGVAANVSAATNTGIAGLSIEDSTGDPASPLFEFALAVDRIEAARRAIDESGTGVLLTARSEGFIAGRPDLDETIRRLSAYAAAGADCLHAPGLRQLSDIEAVVRAVSPKPVNVLMYGGFATLEMLAAAGVRRISVGGALARVAWTAFLNAARDIQARGVFTAFDSTVSFAEIGRLFHG